MKKFATGEGKLAEQGQRKAVDEKKKIIKDQQGHK
jgi:hypothetical protein